MSDLGRSGTTAWCLAVALVGLASPASGQDRAGEAVRKTIRGEVRTGTLDSSVGDYSFLPQSRAAASIFRTCKVNDECQADADLKGDQIVSVRSVRLLKRAE
jgi:hypothetical protein